MEYKTIDDMTVKDAVAWLRPETSRALISNARLRGLSKEEVVRIVDHAIGIVCDIAEKRGE